MATTALVKRSADTALMPPPPPPKRIRRPTKVLDEETYTSALSHIIARDFFPGLLETESQQDYLNALDAGDEGWIEEAERRVKEVLDTPRSSRRGVSMTPRGIGGETPRGWAGQTPLRTPSRLPGTPARSDSVGGPVPQEEQVDLNLSLEAFQAKYISEDNESFNKVLDRQNATKRANYGWLWNANKLPSARQIAQAAQQQKRESASASGGETALTLRPSQDQDLRPAGIALIRAQDPRNNFMFAPPSLADTHPTLQTSFQAAQDASRAAPKSVSYASTRLPTALDQDADADETASVADTTSLSAVDAAIAGRLRHRAASTLAREASAGGETPRVNGYAFVDEEPTPGELGPSQSGPGDQRRQKIDDALLRRLIEAHGAGGAGRNPFSIQEKSRREDLHHRMVDKQLASIRPSGIDRGRLAALQGRTLTPRFTSSPVVGRRLVSGTPGASDTPASPSSAGLRQRLVAGSLTPAAQSLYERVGRTPVRMGGGGAFDGERKTRLSGMRQTR